MERRAMEAWHGEQKAQFKKKDTFPFRSPWAWDVRMWDGDVEGVDF